MRSVQGSLSRGLMLAFIALACAHCGSVKAAAKASKADASDEFAATIDGGDSKGEDGGTNESDASIPDSGGDATVVGAGGDTCANATPIALSAKNPRVDLLATTLGATHDVDATCSPDQGADVFYSFTVSKRVFVYADTFGASWNTVLFLLSSACQPLTSTMPGGSVCNDDGCGSSQSQIVALLEPGSYRLGLAGHGSAQGTATIHFEWALAGSGTAQQLPSVNSVQVGVTAGSGGNIDGISSDCLAAAAENSYWWARCPSDPAQTINATTCGGGTTWESVIEGQIPKNAPSIPSAYQCNLDGCSSGFQSNLTMGIPTGAGLGVLSIDGQAGQDVGPYSMTVTYTP